MWRGNLQSCLIEREKIPMSRNTDRLCGKTLALCKIILEFRFVLFVIDFIVLFTKCVTVAKQSDAKNRPFETVAGARIQNYFSDDIFTIVIV